VHGWDGTGYRRFFSATKADFLSWKLSNIPAWFVSDVALTLIIFGVLMVPLLLLMMSAWILEGARQGDAASGGTPEATRGQVAGRILKMIFVGALGLAIAASLLVRLAGWIFGAAWGWALGLLVFFAAAYLLALRRGAYLHRLAGQMLCSREPLP